MINNTKTNLKSTTDEYEIFYSPLKPEIYSFRTYKAPSRRLIDSSGMGEYSDNRARLLYEYCKDNELLAEINKPENLHLKAILESTLVNLTRYLNEKKSKDGYTINCYFWKDIELPSWEQIIVEVRTKYSNLEEMDNLWDDVINIVKESYKRYLRRVSLEENQAEIEALNKICPAIESL